MGCKLPQHVIRIPCNMTITQVLGPFPIHAREQYFLTPGFPLNCKLVPADCIPHTVFYVFKCRLLMSMNQIAPGRLRMLITVKQDGLRRIQMRKVTWKCPFPMSGGCSVFKLADSFMRSQLADGIHCDPPKDGLLCSITPFSGQH